MGLALHNSDVDLDSPLPDFRSAREPSFGRARPNRSPAYLFKGADCLYDRHGTVWLNRSVPGYKQPLLDLARRSDPRHRVDRRRQLHRLRQRWVSENDEGADLAHSDIPLPGLAPVRRPSLERQEAFRDPSTAKRNVNPPAIGCWPAEDEDSDVADLYRMGLLYDDEHARGDLFNLDAIVHQEPVYTLRPAKRSRKQNKRDEDLALALNLSFTELAHDDAIAQYLMSPQASEADMLNEAAIQHSSSAFAPLRVIYELMSSNHSIHDAPAAEEAPPGLVPDSDSDLHAADSEKENDDDEAGWAVLAAREADEAAVASDDGGGAADAWIVLGDDS